MFGWVSPPHSLDSLLRGIGDTRTLYDTAANVVMLRDDRVDCRVRRGWCQEHDRVARKITTMKQVWTRYRIVFLLK